MFRALAEGVAHVYWIIMMPQERRDMEDILY